MAVFDVIKFEDNGKTLVYKYPHEDFNTKSQLVVQQAQEAIFFSRGAMADHFTVPGTYTLETKNIPILCKLINLPFGKESPFRATVFFFDKTERMNNKWGVGNIPFVSKEYGLPMSIGLCGEYSFKMGDAEIFVNKVLGTVSQYEDDQIIEFADKYVQQLVTAHMSQYLAENSFDLFTLEKHLIELSDMLLGILQVAFADYGITLTKFIITMISKHEDTPEYRRFFELYTLKTKTIEEETRSLLGQAQVKANMEIAARQKQGELNIQQYDIALEKNRIDMDAYREVAMRQAEAAGLSALGTSKAQMEAFEVAKLTAQNEGAGNFASAGMGLGIGLGTMGAAATAVGGIYNDALSHISGTDAKEPQPEPKAPSFGVDLGSFSGDVGLGGASTPAQEPAAFCENCGEKLAPGALFCDNCGASQQTADKCRKCGFVFERPGKFCPKCGEKR